MKVRGVKLTVQDLHEIARFHRIFKNYIKIKRLEENISNSKE